MDIQKNNQALQKKQLLEALLILSGVVSGAVAFTLAMTLGDLSVVGAFLCAFFLALPESIGYFFVHFGD